MLSLIVHFISLHFIFHNSSLAERGPRSIGVRFAIGTSFGLGLGLGILTVSLALSLAPTGRASILPKLQVAVLTQCAPLHQDALVLQYILYGDFVFPENTQVIGDDMAVSARWAGDEDAAVVVALLGDVVGGPRAAGDAGEGEFVRGRDIGIRLDTVGGGGLLVVAR